MINHDDFLPVGFQYYRAPTPRADCWAADLAKIKADGFNTVKYWVQWRWSVPARDEYYFADTDRLMDLAQQFGLKVIINVIFDCTPSWFLEKHPDAPMITQAGHVVHPQAYPARQIGGAPNICFHHPTGLTDRLKFLEETVKHYARHPALYCWDLWNEAELTAILRELKFDDLVCYCPHSFAAFRAWLQKKYGALETLNAAWQRNYRQWEHVEIPRALGTFNDMIDWRLFFVDTLTQELRDRVRVTKQHDATHPVMCHTVPPPIFNSITCAADDWALAAECDWHGNSLGSLPLPANLLHSAAQGRKLINSEVHAVPGMTLWPHPRPTDNDMLRHIFVPLARGVEGFVFWQYRPETLGLESPAWGSVDLEGRDTPWHVALKKINQFLQAERELILGREAIKPVIGIFLDPKNEIFTWIATRSLDLYFGSVQGTYQMLYDRNYDVMFVRAADLPGLNLRALFLPPLYYFNQASADALTNWVAAGGLLISEPFLGSVDEATGLHNSVVPGFGLDRLFGAKQSSVTAEDPRLGEFTGHKYRVDYRTTAPALATFADGAPAITTNAHGHGRAVLTGTPLGWSYHRQPNAALAGFFDDLLRGHGIAKNKFLAADTAARVDVICNKERALIVIDNQTNESQTVAFTPAVRLTENVFHPKAGATVPAKSLAVFRAVIEEATA